MAKARPARPTEAPDPGRWGICCSGGGIRSASYCLGALQVLREEGVLAGTKYLSAVSGGSYIAAAIASSAAMSHPDDPIPPFAPGSREEQHLRTHSSYMAPTAEGKAQLFFRVIAGAVWHLVLVFALAAIIAWPASLIYAQVSDQLAGRDDGVALNHLGRWALVVVVPLLVCLGLNLEVWKADHRRAVAERLSWFTLWLAVGLATVLILIPQGILLARAVDNAPLADLAGSLVGGKDGKSAENATGLLGVLGGSAAATAIAGALSTFISSRYKILLRVAAFVAGPLIVLTPVLIFVNLGAEEGFRLWLLGAWAGLILLVGLVWLWGDLTQWSLHPFYRRRLSSAFFKRTGDLPWTDLVQPEPNRSGFPELVVCAAANVSEPGATPPGRAAMPFVFTTDKIGVPGEEHAMATYRSGDEAVTVPRAVAMSGAAVSPLMGKKTIRAVRFLMALMNVRLGVWLENPGRHGQHSGRPRPQLLLREMVGFAKLSDHYIYVTDGGHFDNLGLVELLRRGCTTVFCLDGGGDPPGTFRALGEAVALSRSELQVDIDIEPSPIAPKKKTGVAKQPYALGTLRFRSSPDGSAVDGDATGRIVYCRAAVTADAPWDVRDFAGRDKRFPFHSTMDQLFTDEKFESYRALGAHAARQAVQAWRSEGVRANARGRLPLLGAAVGTGDDNGAKTVKF
jgi:hypothetical protein